MKDQGNGNFYIGLIILDLVSHWAQMYRYCAIDLYLIITNLMRPSTLMIGGQSHKENNTNPIMKLYYLKPILFTFCAGNEA